MEIMEKFISFFTSIGLLLSYLFGFASAGVTDGFTVVSKQKLSPVSSLYSGQGLCFDGEYYYTSGSITALNFTGLAKFDSNMKRVAAKGGRVPAEFHDKYGSNHLGGIDCANGFIYAPVEGDIEGKGYLYNFILLYDCETLEYTGKYFNLTSEYLDDGIPWCAVDSENGYLYTSKFDPVGEILQYDLETMEFIGAIPLSEQIRRVQGGSVYKGILYLSYDSKEAEESEIIYSVNPASGEVNTVFERTMPGYDNEAEDICVYPMPDGSLFHTLDYDKLICVNIHHVSKDK